MTQQAINRPSSRYDHVFAVIRVENYPDVEQDEIEDVFTITKVVHTQNEAEHEVERLNNLNGSESTRYFWQLTRLEKRTAHTELVR